MNLVTSVERDRSSGRLAGVLWGVGTLSFRANTSELCSRADANLFVALAAINCHSDDLTRTDDCIRPNRFHFEIQYFWHLDEGTFHALSSNCFSEPHDAN